MVVVSFSHVLGCAQRAPSYLHGRVMLRVFVSGDTVLANIWSPCHRKESR